MKLGHAAALAIAAAGCTGGTEVATTEQAAVACADGPIVRGMDVSSYDTVTDWSAAKAGGITFAFIRASDGTQFPDPDFATNWAGAKSAGVIRGAYQFFRPAEDPIAQADLLLSATGPYQPGDLPPVLDLEVSGGLSTADVTAAVEKWIAHVTAAIGRPPIVYAGLYSWPTLTGGADLTTSPLWVAQYTSAACPDIPDPWTRWAFWQDSATGSAPGVAGSGTLDVDQFNGSYDDLVAFAGAPPPPCGTIAAGGGMIDDTDACFTAGGPATYLRHVTGAGEGGTLIWTHATDAASEANFAQWNLDFAQAGTYLVEAYTDHAYATSTQAGYLVQGAGGAQTVTTIDQSAVDGWQALGTFQFAAGGDQWIHLGDNTGEPASANAQLVFDAIRLTPVDPGDGSGSGSGSGSGGIVDHPHHSAGCAAGGGGAGWLIVLALPWWRRRRPGRRN